MKNRNLNHKDNWRTPKHIIQKLEEEFVRKAVEQMKLGRTSIVLLPVSTSTKLFHEIILPNRTKIIFVKRRIKFEGHNTKGELVNDKCGMHDSMFVIFKQKKK